MFYDGDLQSGIALALEDSKLVACFIKGFPLLQLSPMPSVTECISYRRRRSDLAMGKRLSTRPSS